MISVVIDLSMDQAAVSACLLAPPRPAARTLSKNDMRGVAYDRE